MAENNWFDKPMRWAQLTLTDTDPGAFDPDFWLRYFRESRCDGAVISSGGYLAFYPTEIPYHHRATTLGDLDAFGYLVNGCREMGMSIICRTGRDLLQPMGRFGDLLLRLLPAGFPGGHRPRDPRR